jgi:hypothetical protein
VTPARDAVCLLRFSCRARRAEGPEIIRRDLEPNPRIPDEPFTGGLQGPSSKTPPAMYFDPAALFMAMITNPRVNTKALCEAIRRLVELGLRAKRK